MKTALQTLADGKIGVITLEGDVDFSVLADMRGVIEQAWTLGPSCLLVDLSEVTFVASDGLGVLIEAQRKAEAQGRRLDLVHPQQHILNILEKTQLTHLFHIYDSVQDALESRA